MSEEYFKTVVVLGMHRSGTSLVAGILERLGVNMGENQVGATWSNPLGHYENIDFVKMNDKILKEAGGSWVNPPSEDDVLTSKKSFHEEIDRLVKSSESEIWGWKDPRTSLTIEIYLPFLKNPYFIVCHREQQDIARSLQKRGDMRAEKALKLNEIYSLRIENFFKKHSDHKRLDLRYENIIKNPEKEIRRIIKFLELNPSRLEFEQAINFVLSPRRKLIKKAFLLIKAGVKIPCKIIKRH